jgi:hypothetical protein
VKSEKTSRGTYEVGVWEPWFACYPVHLFGTARIAWLRRISRRHVFVKGRFRLEYSDTPSEFAVAYAHKDDDSFGGHANGL